MKNRERKRERQGERAWLALELQQVGLLTFPHTSPYRTHSRSYPLSKTCTQYDCHARNLADRHVSIKKRHARSFKHNESLCNTNATQENASFTPQTPCKVPQKHISHERKRTPRTHATHAHSTRFTHKKIHPPPFTYTALTLRTKTTKTHPSPS